jgi:hypothetical protein
VLTQPVGADVALTHAAEKAMTRRFSCCTPADKNLEQLGGVKDSSAHGAEVVQSDFGGNTWSASTRPGKRSTASMNPSSISKACPGT